MTESSRAAERTLHDRPLEEFVGSRDLTHWKTPVGRWLAAQVQRASHWERVRFILLGLLLTGGVVVLGFTAVAAKVYDAVEDGDGIAGFDRPVLDLALRMRTPWLERGVTYFTDIGGPTVFPVLAALLAIAAAIAWRRWSPIILTALAAAGSLAMTVLGKNLVGRVRPPLADAVPPYENSPSFPSGHTLNTTVIIGILVYLLLGQLSSARSRLIAVLAAAAWIGAMGLSRVYLGHHWLTDVAMGWALGLAWVAVLILAHRLVLTRRRAAREKQAAATA